MAVNDAMREQCLRLRTPSVENTFRPQQGCCPDCCSGKEMSRAAQQRAFRSSQQTMVFLVGLAAQEEAKQRCGSSLEENREPFTTSSCKPQIDVRSSCGNGDSWHFLWLEREGPAVRKLPAPLGLHSWVPWAQPGCPLTTAASTAPPQHTSHWQALSTLPGPSGQPCCPSISAATSFRPRAPHGTTAVLLTRLPASTAHRYGETS